MTETEYEVIDEINEENLSYEFNDLLLLKDSEDSLYWTTDSGCSCPERLENFTFPTDANPLNLHTLAEFEKAVKDFPADIEEKQRLITKVKKLLRSK